MAGFTFSWGGSGDIAILGKHTLRIGEDDFAFEAAFEASPATYSGSAGAHDGQFATGLATAHGYIGKNKAFTFKKGSSTLLTFDPSANTGFLTHASVANTSDPHNTGRYQIRRITVTGQKPAIADSRAGRREAALAISRKPDGLRAVKFTGVWTAITTPLAALASYDASIATWVATWLGTSNVLAPATNCFWVKTSETPLVLDEQNKLLTFERFYEERFYSSTPSDSSPSSGVADPSGNILAARFFEIPTLNIGSQPSLNYDGFRVNVVYGPKWDPANVAVPIPGVFAVGSDDPTRYGFELEVQVKQTYGTPRAWFEAVGLAWVRSTLTSLWPRSASQIVESLNFVVTDGSEQKGIISGTLLAPNTSGVLSYTEALEVADPKTTRFAAILNGVPHSYDISGGPPIQTSTQVVSIITLGSSPSAPPYLTSPWAFVDGSETHASRRVGWFRIAAEPRKSLYEHSYRREYLRVDHVGGTVPFPVFNPFGAVKT